MSTTPQRVDEALQDVGRWRGEQRAKLDAEVAEVEDAIDALRAQIAELESSITDKEGELEAVEARARTIDEAIPERTYHAIFSALSGQMEAVGLRAVAASEARAEAEAGFLDAIEDETLQSLLAEYRQFKEQVEPTLDALPASYRSVVAQHNDGVKHQLREAFEEMELPRGAVDADDLGIDVVLAVDAPGEQAEVVMLVLPVSEQVQLGWAGRGEDLQTFLAARVVEGAYRACHELDQRAAQALFGGHQGLLAVEIEVSGDPEKVQEVFMERIAAATAAAPELTDAAVSVQVRVVNVDHLLPPEDAFAESEPAPTDEE